jgi:hypothetical protein
VKKCYLVMAVVACLVAAVTPPDSQAAPINKLHPAYERFLDSPVMTPDMTPQLKSAVALSLTMGETGMGDRNSATALMAIASPDVTDSLTSDTGFIWSTDHWAATNRTTRSYDGSGRMSGQVSETLHVATWVNSDRSNFFYNGSGTRVDSMRQQSWVASAWKNSILNLSYYSGSNLDSGIILSWSGTAWVKFFKSVTTVSGGHTTSQLLSSWSGSAWVNQSLLSYSYDGGGHLTQYLTQHWSGSAWTNQVQYVYTYTGGGDPATQTYQTWTGSAWNNVSKHSYVVDGSHHTILDTTSSWAASFWFPMDVDSSKYTGNLLMEYVHASLLGGGGDRYLYTYNANNQTTSEIFQTWDFGASQYVNDSKTVFVYGTGGGGSCCVGMRGNINNSGGIELADLSALVSYLTGGGYVPPCMEAANVNGTGAVELADLSALVSYLTGGGYVPPSCP